MALVESAGAAYIGNSSSTNTITSGSFTPSANNLIVAIAAWGNGNGVAWTNASISDSKSHTWFQLAQELEAAGGGAAVWCADAGATPSAMTVTVTASPSTVLDPCLIVRQFSGALPAAFQVAGVQGAAGGTIDTITLTPTFTGSQIVGGFGAPVVGAVTANGSTTIYGQTQGNAGSTEGLFEANSTSTAGTALTLGFSATKATTGIAAAEIMPATANVLALVGSAGSVAVSAAGSGASPGWGTGANRTAGDLLVALVAGAEITGATPPTPSGWTLGASVTAASTSMTMFWKIAAGSDAAPTFTGHAANVQSAMLLEFAASNSGTIAATPTDKSGTHTTTTTSTPNAVAASATDTGTNAQLVIGGTSISYSAAAVKTLTNTPGEAMAFTSVSSAAVSTRAHYNFYWGHTNSNSAADSNSLAYTSTNGQGSSQVIQSFLLPTSGSVITQSIGASLTPTASMNQQTGALLSATLNFTGSFVRAIHHGISATANFVGSFVRKVTRTLNPSILGLATTEYDSELAALSPQGWWKLADLPNQSTAIDSSGGGHAGSVQGTVTFGNAPIRTFAPETSALFDGNTGYITTSLTAPSGAFSLAAWAFLPASQGSFPDQFPYIAACTTNSNNSGVALGIGFQGSFGPINNTFFFVGDGSTQHEIDWFGAQLVPNTWAFLVGTWDGSSTINFYANGQPINFAACASIGTGIDWSIGANNGFSTGYNDFWPNGIGQVAVFNYQLSNAQQQNLYQAAISGTLFKQTQIPTNASIGSSGSFTRAVGAVLSSALSFAGTFASKAIGALLSGTLSFAGSIISTFPPILQTLTATLSFVGSQAKQTGRALSGTLSSAGTFVRETFALLSGTLSSAGSFVRAIRTSTLGTAALNFVGTLAKQTNRLLSATISFAASLTTSSVILQALSATFSFAGSIVRQTGAQLSGTLSFAGSFVRSIGAQLSGTLNFVGTFVRAINTKTLGTAILSFAGSISKQANRTFSATLSFAATVTKQAQKVFTPTLSFATSTTRAVGAQLAATLQPVGTLAKRIARAISGVLSWVGTLIQQALGAIVPGHVSITNVPAQAVITSTPALAAITSTAASVAIAGTPARAAITSSAASVSIITEVNT